MAVGWNAAASASCWQLFLVASIFGRVRFFSVSFFLVLVEIGEGSGVEDRGGASRRHPSSSRRQPSSPDVENQGRRRQEVSPAEVCFSRPRSVFQFTFACGISDEGRDREKSREKVVGRSGEKDESRVPEQIRGGAADVRIRIMLYFVSITKYYVFEDSVTIGVLSKRLELGAAQISMMNKCSWLFCHDVADHGKYYSDDGDIEGDSVYSDSDGLEYRPRDTILDDALFGFFRKQAVKSLKRNFSDFCMDGSANMKAKPNTHDGVSRNVFSRYSIKYYVEVIRKLTVEQRSVIEKFGFGCLLLLDLHDIPSQFARWVADCVDPVCSQITVCYKHIDISKSTVHLILGLPKDGLEVPCNSDEGREFILSHFHLSEMPHITFFGNKLCGSEVLSEHDIFVCFMVGIQYVNARTAVFSLQL
ncbi:uncharacterized protein LOC124707779 [Lolium rigidum]|uniref:uncharacterized protein LOC124707779 n=1 Tax=Lolium rigidum TaxID=89674 RepID=UPI001F5DD2F0|nr:uncharacterized protein LOC124707779 [Lolium rigidum]